MRILRILLTETGVRFTRELLGAQSFAQQRKKEEVPTSLTLRLPAEEGSWAYRADQLLATIYSSPSKQLRGDSVLGDSDCWTWGAFGQRLARCTSSNFQSTPHLVAHLDPEIETANKCAHNLKACHFNSFPFQIIRLCRDVIVMWW